MKYTRITTHTHTYSNRIYNICQLQIINCIWIKQFILNIRMTKGRHNSNAILSFCALNSQIKYKNYNIRNFILFILKTPCYYNYTYINYTNTQSTSGHTNLFTCTNCFQCIHCVKGFYKTVILSMLWCIWQKKLLCIKIHQPYIDCEFEICISGVYQRL